MISPKRFFKFSTSELMDSRQQKDSLHAKLFDTALKGSLLDGNLGTLATLEFTKGGVASFYFSEAVTPLVFEGLKVSPRISVKFNDSFNSGMNGAVIIHPALIEVDIEFQKYQHQRGAINIKLEFPHRLFGLNKLFNNTSKSTTKMESIEAAYSGLLFNNTPSEYGNLYDVFNFLSAAFAMGLKIDKEIERLDAPDLVISRLTLERDSLIKKITDTAFAQGIIHKDAHVEFSSAMQLIDDLAKNVSCAQLNDEPIISSDFDLFNSIVTEGRFSGLVVDVTKEGFVLQKVNRDGTTVKHALSSLSQVVTPGDVVDVKYVFGRGVVSGLPDLSLDR
jgi:hypothetical protein